MRLEKMKLGFSSYNLLVLYVWAGPHHRVVLISPGQSSVEQRMGKKRSHPFVRVRLRCSGFGQEGKVSRSQGFNLSRPSS